jgi:hypothetical protein
MEEPSAQCAQSVHTHQLPPMAHTARQHKHRPPQRAQTQPLALACAHLTVLRVFVAIAHPVRKGMGQACVSVCVRELLELGALLASVDHTDHVPPNEAIAKHNRRWNAVIDRQQTASFARSHGLVGGLCVCIQSVRELGIPLPCVSAHRLHGEHIVATLLESGPELPYKQSGFHPQEQPRTRRVPTCECVCALLLGVFLPPEERLRQVLCVRHTAVLVILQGLDGHSLCVCRPRGESAFAQLLAVEVCAHLRTHQGKQ